MKTSLVIVGGGLGLAALVTLILRRQFLLSEHRAIARRQGWVVEPDGAVQLYPHLSRSHLLSIGHSRRLTEAFRCGEKTWVMPYVFDTGFEYRMHVHRWMVSVRDSSHGAGPATITSQPWLLAAAYSSWCAQLSLRDFVGEVAPEDEQRTVIVDDVDEWRRRLSGELAAWFFAQPSERSWEILPGMILGYQPGTMNEQTMASLASSTDELFQLLNRDQR